ncbi:MAG: UvrD-helicase domain-containing protein [Deltaproteobacteria bacterium]|nr:UvrD-helicase domain-containing protein [Deltaproteobacteria bacterium]
MRLNAQQRAAVEHEEGPLLVLAGAGSGKTRVIIARIARLLASGVAPNAILAVTFTNKAANEMRDRIGATVGDETAKAIWLSTFHSFGVRFVREEAKALGLGSRFTIFDQGDSLGVVRELLRTEAEADRRLDAQAILSRISLWKNALREPGKVRAKGDEYDQVAASIYGAYESTLADMHAVDFDDLVVKPVRLLRDRPGIRSKWRTRFAHVLVDEFQDTNVAQLDLVRLLANERGNVCVVGDDDQSIYGWRGACVDNILDFEQYFPGAVVTKLEQNYRSCAPILNVANSAIEKSRKRPYAKVLKATRKGGSPVRMCVLPEPQEEAKFVAAEIRRLEREGTDPRQIAVLYRSNTQAKLLEEELRIAGISYRVFGGTKFFDRKEIKDGIAYLRIALNPRDELSLRRIMNTPARGLGAQSLRHIADHAEAHRMSLLRALRSADRIEALSARAKASAVRLGDAIETAGKGLRAGDLTGAATSLLRTAGMLQDGGDQSPDAKRRRANIDFLLRSIERLEARSGADRRELQQLLHHIALDPSNPDEPETDRQVTLSSLHSAKGLEFSVVFLIGCVEGVLPHARTIDPKITDASMADLEEERRLFYVGVTRARDVLYLTRHKDRVARGRLVKITPSRFLQGLPDADLESYQSTDTRELERQEVADMAKALLERLGATDA